MKRYLVAVGVGASVLLGSLSVSAFPVFDASNFAQNVMQVKHMLAQLSQMRQQLDQGKAQLNAIKGERGMGRIVTESSRDYIPRNWREALDMGGGDIDALANDIRATAGFLSDADMESINAPYRDQVRRNGDAALRGQAMQAAVFERSGERFGRIKILMDRIDQAEDAKAIEDLQARIATEEVMLQNELVRAQAMTAMLEARNEVREESERQSMLLK
jgi:type IV secretion system protein VirB5